MAPSQVCAFRIQSVELSRGRLWVLSCDRPRSVRCEGACSVAVRVRSRAVLDVGPGLVAPMAAGMGAQLSARGCKAACGSDPFSVDRSADATLVVIGFRYEVSGQEFAFPYPKYRPWYWRCPVSGMRVPRQSPVARMTGYGTIRTPARLFASLRVGHWHPPGIVESPCIGQSQDKAAPCRWLSRPRALSHFKVDTKWPAAFADASPYDAYSSKWSRIHLTHLRYTSR